MNENERKPCSLCGDPAGFPRVGGPAPSICEKCEAIIAKWTALKNAKAEYFERDVLGVEPLDGVFGKAINKIEVAVAQLKAIHHNELISKEAEHAKE